MSNSSYPLHLDTPRRGPRNRPHPQRQRKSLRPSTGTEAKSSYLLTAVADGFAMTLVRNETQRHSAALKNAGQNPVGLLPLDGFGSAVPSFQLYPVFGIDTERVPPNDAMSRFVGLGDKSWDNSKNFFRTQSIEFLFLSQRTRRTTFGRSISPKTPVLKLNRPFACKPPAAIASELTRVACALFAKPQVAGLRHS